MILFIRASKISCHNFACSDKKDQRKLWFTNKNKLGGSSVLTDNDQAGRQAKVEIQRKFGRMYKLTFPVLSNKDVGDMTVKNIKEKILVNLKGTY